MIGKLGKVGLVVCGVFVILAIISAILPRINGMYQPLYGTDPEIIGYSGPSSQHILGTDFFGRDLFSQLCAGAFAALWQGLWWSVFGVIILVIAAFVMAQIREETPQLQDTATTRYVRFVAFPLGVTGLLMILSFALGISMGRLSWVNMLIIVCFTGLAGLMAWLAVGHNLEMQVRKGEKISRKLLLSGAALIFSYVTIYTSFLAFLGLGDPSVVSWGMMLQWCFISGHTFKAPIWLTTPILCVYVFSRGMLALSYGLYNSLSAKFFFIEGWF